MITPEHEYYARCILLLLQGGTSLLREIVEKALRAKNETLNQFLKSIEKTVTELEHKKKHLTQTQKDALYPTTPQGASIETFDITLLSYLIITHLEGYVDDDELSATETIRDARNAYLHSTESKIETLEYIREWSALATVILTVGSRISPDVERKHKDIVDSISCKSQLETESILELIKKHDPSKEFLEKIMKNLEETMANTDNIQTGQEQLAVAVQNLQNTEENTNAYIKDIIDEVKILRLKHDQQEKVLTLISSILIIGKVQIQPNDQETKDKVVTSVDEACKRFDANSPPKDALQEMTFKLCKELKDLDIELQNIKSGCIQFEFKCLSLTALLELSEYFYSQTFQTHLDNIAAAFEEVTGKRIGLTVTGITRQSLRDVIRNMDVLETSSNEPDSKEKVLETKAVIPDIKKEVPYSSGDKRDVWLEQIKQDIADVLEMSSNEPDSKEKVLETKAVIPDIKKEVPYSSGDKRDVWSEQIKQDIAGVHKDTKELKDMLTKTRERTTKEGRIAKIVHTKYGKLYLSADDQETVDVCEAVLHEIIIKEEPTEISHQSIQEKVACFVEDIENLDVKVVDIHKG